MENKEEKVPIKEAIKLNKRAFKVWWTHYKEVLISSSMASIVQALTPYVAIYFSARIINELAGGRNRKVLMKLILIVLLSSAVLALLNASLKRWKNSVYSCIYFENRKIYNEKLLSMDFNAVDDMHTHDVYSQILQNEYWVGFGLNKLVYQFEGMVLAVIKILGAVALSYSLFTLYVPESAGKLTILNNPLFLFFIVILMIIVTFASPIFSNKANEYWIRYASDAKFGNRMFFFYGSMPSDRSRSMDIRMYRQDILCKNYIKKLEIFGPKSKIAEYGRGPMGAYAALSAVVSNIFMGIVYVFVCLKAWAGAFGVGSVTQYISAISSLSDGLSEFIRILGEMRVNASFLRTTFEFLDIPHDMYKGSLTVEKRSDNNYEVEFKNVSFKYPKTDSYALKNISMRFKIGERLAVVGQNGSGKTTFIKLLCRMYDPTEGEILLNGIDIRKYDYKEYMSVFSVVFQDFKLLAFELAQNVAAGVNYEKDKVVDCLEKAGFEDRLKTMPEGIDTFIYKDFNDNGAEISGGEAQKLAIARALYKDSPFIILDEPTAALDPVAEYEIYTRFNDMVKDKTAIYISHRLSSCRFCDEIAVFNEGELIQKGSHEDLVSDEKGKYYELWNAQKQYYVEE